MIYRLIKDENLEQMLLDMLNFWSILIIDSLPAVTISPTAVDSLPRVTPKVNPG
jgi:hypothetical protein